MRTAVIDLDDLHSEEQFDLLVPLKEAIPGLHVTLYAVPNLLGPVHELKERYPWVTFAIHGFEHSYAECRSWTDELAKVNIALALGMGYAPLFKPPQWLCDQAVEAACRDLSVVLHHHTDYVPQTDGLRVYHEDLVKSPDRTLHTHLQKNPATDWLGTHVYFTPTYLKRFDAFVSVLERAQ